MTVRELISALQEEDGEAEVLTRDGPIYFIEGKPGWYDGQTSILIHDEKKKPYYSIIGYRKDPCRDKVFLNSMNLEDCLYSCNSQKEVDDFIVQGDSSFLDKALELKEEVKKNFAEWDKP